MVFTWTVENTVVNLLLNQIIYLRVMRHSGTRYCRSNPKDEGNYRDMGIQEGGAGNIFYEPLRIVFSTFTQCVIRFGMRQFY